MSQIENTKVQALISAAKDGFNKAYAPYSQFRVGAAALTANGKIVKGCNVENASYGLTVCAERNCLAQGVIAGEQRFTAMVIYTNQEKLTPPCGACRQVIAEFLAPEALVMAVNNNNNSQQWTVSELLPDAFTPQDLLTNKEII
ncbi:cytidine deaminase [Colwellia chukchiensis]|uniref:Cytidine deaminase n=1 Tax=Colwellia chukchiensis TaxID=641665 RepID=A0A1H7SRL7_9GAMM|nr:cytidine deaminase [Colwellia chukchiensis]SEL75039.1 cytidine deaminase [Colwellia chukchiensis]